MKKYSALLIGFVIGHLIYMILFEGDIETVVGVGLGQISMLLALFITDKLK